MNADVEEPPLWEYPWPYDPPTLPPVTPPISRPPSPETLPPAEVPDTEPVRTCKCWSCWHWFRTWRLAREREGVVPSAARPPKELQCDGRGSR